MATEYYIVKPSTQETFYLGKRISCLDGVPNWNYRQEADYASWEDIHEVFRDILDNSPYFLEYNMRWGDIMDFCANLYDFCDAPVYFDNDCSDNTEWRDYKDVDKLIGHFVDLSEEIADLVTIIPKQYWQVDDHIIDELKTLQNYITTCNQK